MICMNWHLFWHHRQGYQREEREATARLEKAEAELRDLKSRADLACRILDDRQKRNHFAESLRATLRER